MKKIFKSLFLLLLVLFSLGQLQRVQLTKVVSFYIHDLVLVIWLVLTAVKFPVQSIKLAKKILNNKLFIFSSSWIVLGMIISYLNTGFSPIPLLYLLRVLAYLAFGLSLTLVKPFSKKIQYQLWIMVGALIAAWGLLQYFTLPDTRFLKYLGWDDHYFRLIGTQFDPSFTGILLVITLLLTQNLKKNAWLKRVGSLLLTVAILLTYSRASYLSLVVGVGTLILIQLRQSKLVNYFLISLMSLFLLLIPFLPRPEGDGVKLERTFSIQSRISSNQTTLQQLKGYQWIIGQGLFTSYRFELELPQVSTAHFPDNLLVFILNSTGIIGLAIFSYILYKRGLWMYENDIFIFSAFVAILIHAQFNHTLFQPFVWLWIICAQILISKADG